MALPHGNLGSRRGLLKSGMCQRIRMIRKQFNLIRVSRAGQCQSLAFHGATAPWRSKGSIGQGQRCRFAESVPRRHRTDVEISGYEFLPITSS